MAILNEELSLPFEYIRKDSQISMVRDVNSRLYGNMPGDRGILIGNFSIESVCRPLHVEMCTNIYI